MPPPESKPPIDPARAAESNFGRMMAVNGTFHALAIVVVVLRMYVRIRIVKSFGWDDGFMIAALLFLFGGGMVAQIYAGTHGALGRHQETVTLEELHVYGKMRLVQGLLMTVMSICLLKISIALSLLRLNAGKWYKRILWALIVFIVCYMIESLISLLAFCDPIKAHWDKEAFKTARCFSRDTVNTFAAMNTAYNIFTDICLATIPIPMLWRLQTKLRIRLYLIGIFNLGYITVGIGIVKLICQQTTRGDPDQTYHNWIQFFGLLQQNIGIIAACVPMLKPLFAKSLHLQSSYGTGGPSGRVNDYELSGARRGDRSNVGYVRDVDSDPDYDMQNFAGRVSTDQSRSTVVKGGISDDGSETFILQDSPETRGVMMKTEITVTQTPR